MIKIIITYGTDSHFNLNKSHALFFIPILRLRGGKSVKIVQTQEVFADYQQYAGRALEGKTMKILQRIVLTWAIVMLTTFITMPNAYAKDPAYSKDQAAIVIVATGEFFAIDKKQTRRKLNRRSKIYVGDTLVTGDKGRAQIRFIDGAVVALRPGSELNIQKYSYGKVKADEGSLMTLIKGGFRTITGAIGKEKYKVITSMATIGIRGTHYEAVINNNQLFVALWDGGVTVKNNAGQIDLGLGADYNFGMVQGQNIEPQGQIDPPAAIVNDSKTVIAPDLSSNTSSSKDNSSSVAANDSSALAPPESAWQDISAISSSDTNSGTGTGGGVTMPTTGTASYVNVASVSATGTTSSISNFAYNATVDFAAATINGSMSFDSVTGGTPHNWSVQFNGGPGSGNGVNGSNFSMNVDTPNSTVDGFDNVTGTVSGSFAGSNAEQMVGSFNLTNQVDPTVTAEGTFTATQ